MLCGISEAYFCIVRLKKKRGDHYNLLFFILLAIFAENLLVIPGRLNAYLIYNTLEGYFYILDVILDVKYDCLAYQKI